MKRQFGILVLVACMILATVPTALCARQNQNYDESVIITNTTAEKYVTIEKGETIYVKVLDYDKVVLNELVTFTEPSLEISSDGTYFTNGILKVYLKNIITTDTTSSAIFKAINVGTTTIQTTYYNSDGTNGNVFVLHIKVVSQNEQ